MSLQSACSLLSGCTWLPCPPGMGDWRQPADQVRSEGLGLHLTGHLCHARRMRQRCKWGVYSQTLA